MSSHNRRTSSETSTASSNSSSSSSHGYYTDTRRSMDASSPAPRVEVLRCSRCAMSVETIVRGRDGSRRVSSEDASASGMVKFGTNLYYCDRCAQMVGYK